MQAGSSTGGVNLPPRGLWLQLQIIPRGDKLIHLLPKGSWGLSGPSWHTLSWSHHPQGLIPDTSVPLGASLGFPEGWE